MTSYTEFAQKFHAKWKKVYGDVCSDLYTLIPANHQNPGLCIFCTNRIEYMLWSFLWDSLVMPVSLF